MHDLFLPFFPPRASSLLLFVFFLARSLALLRATSSVGRSGSGSIVGRDIGLGVAFELEESK